MHFVLTTAALECPAEHGVEVRAITPADGFEARADGVAGEEVRPADFS